MSVLMTGDAVVKSIGRARTFSVEIVLNNMDLHPKMAYFAHYATFRMATTRARKQKKICTTQEK